MQLALIALAIVSLPAERSVIRMPTVTSLRATSVAMLRANSVVMQYSYQQQSYSSQQTYGNQQAQNAYPAYGGQQGYGGQQDYGGQQGGGTQELWCIVGATGQKCLQPGGEQILGRYDMTVQKNTVSREKCVVQVDFNGGATVKSLGKGLTGWRAAAGTAWQWLRAHPDDERALFNGAQVSLDQNDPEGAVFTIQKQAGEASSQQQQGGYGQQQQGGYGQQQQGGYGQQQQQQASLPYGWTAVTDPQSGHTYYYNQQTGQSQWEMPR